jgi:CRP-like cAMP-binding protein
MADTIGRAPSSGATMSLTVVSFRSAGRSADGQYGRAARGGLCKNAQSGERRRDKDLEFVRGSRGPAPPPAMPPQRLIRFDARDVLARLEDRGVATTRKYRKKQAVFSQGDPADAVFHLRSGRIKLTVVSPSGKAAVIAILGEGTVFGEGCLTGQPLRMSTASAVEASSVVRIPRPGMVGLLHDEPEFAELFTAYILSRNVRIEEDLVDQLFNSSEKRLARLLLLLAHFGKDSKPERVIPKISQETLASMIGTTRSRVSFFMNRFRELGFVEYDGGGLQIHSALLSVVLRD